MSPPSPRRLHNLPTQLTTFIGREREIADVQRLLGTARLLTLTGSGGCGKTRLALQVAADFIDQYPDGVWFVDLAPLADPAFVPNTHPESRAWAGAGPPARDVPKVIPPCGPRR